MGYQNDWKKLVVGTDCQVPTISGKRVAVVNFDHAATTSPLHGVMERIFHFSEVYSSVHRGLGYKSMVSSDVYERGRTQLMRFVGADTKKYTLIYTKHTTESLNLLAHVFGERLDRECDVILVSEMEHLANYLPWRMVGQVDVVPVDEKGRLSCDVLETMLMRYGGRVKVVCITGASNVTGYTNPLGKIARIVHRYGAMLVADGAQMAPHMRVDMMGRSSEEAIDFFAFSAHKMYAPFGCGALVGRKDVLAEARPLLVGGGVARFVTHTSLDWNEAPHRDEAGTPNVIGVTAWMEAIRILEEVGREELAKWEGYLLGNLVRELKGIDGIKLYGGESDCVSLVSFTLEGIDHRTVSRILSYEDGIAVRSGMFCAHPYVVRLLGLGEDEVDYYRKHREVPLPGLVRVSISFCNTEDDIERLVRLLKHIVRHKRAYREKYSAMAERDGGAFEWMRSKMRILP